MKKNTSSSRLLTVLLTLCLVCPPGLVFADSPADQYFEQAAEAYQQGDYQAAVELLERAFAQDHDLVYKYNQVLAYQGLGDYAEALRILDIYGEPLMADERFDDIAELREDLENAQKKEREEAKASAPGDTSSAAIDKPPEPEDKDARQPNYLAWSLIGTGGLALGAGALFGSAILVEDEVTRQTSDDPAIYADDPALRESDEATIRSHQTATIAFLATGAVLAGTGGFLLWRGSRQSSPDAAAEAKIIHWAPYVHADGIGATLRLSFD